MHNTLAVATLVAGLAWGVQAQNTTVDTTKPKTIQNIITNFEWYGQTGLWANRWLWLAIGPETLDALSGKVTLNPDWQTKVIWWLQLGNITTNTYTWYQKRLQNLYLDHQINSTNTIQIGQMWSSVWYGWTWWNSHLPSYDDVMWPSPFNQQWIKWIKEWKSKWITMHTWVLANHQWWIGKDETLNSTIMGSVTYMAPWDTAKFMANLWISINKWSTIICPYITNSWNTIWWYATVVINHDGSSNFYGAAWFAETMPIDTRARLLKWTSLGATANVTHTNNETNVWFWSYAKKALWEKSAVRIDLWYNTQTGVSWWVTVSSKVQWDRKAKAKKQSFKDTKTN
jgi:hypothetical protein